MITTDSQRIEAVLTRGVEQVLPDYKTLATLMSQRRIRLYLGIDPTAAFLHLGHSVVLRKLQQFAELGHEVILLVGNGTVKIGDPTGRDESRPMLSDEEIEKNFQDWQRQASTILDFSKISIRHNGDWLDKLNYSDILQLLAKTTVQQLLERDMFQKRMKQGLPIFGHEIIYPLIQGYDSVAMDVDLEVGGNDQTFNMMMGRHLLQQYKQKEKWVLATPLIEGTDGRKMSKTYNNYVALTEDANNMYGKLMSVRDELIVKYFTLLTDVPLKEIQEIEKAMQAGENPMNCKKLLALTITKQYHDDAAATAAADNFSRSFQEGQLPDETLFQDLELHWDEQQKLLSNSFCSNSEWQRLLDQGAIKTLPEQKRLNKEELFALADGSKIKVGKKNWFRLQQIKRSAT